MNNTGYKLQLETAEIDVYYADGRVGTVVLREPVEVPRRTTGSFRTLWRVKISDPLALYVLLRKIEAGDLSQVGIAYALEGPGARKNFARQDAVVGFFEYLWPDVAGR